MVIEILEVFAASIGIVLVWRSALVGRFRNFASSTFLLCYVPLFCVYPLIARWTVGGAISIDVHANEILRDPAIYLIFQGYNIIFLTGCVFLVGLPPFRAEIPKGVSSSANSLWAYGLFSGVCLGIFLYVYSTGLSPFDLLIASRFEWFQSDDYSSLLSVVASYFVALTPALVYLAAKDERRILFVATLLLLIAYGVLSKDRKWLIFLASGLLAARYVKMRFELKFSPRDLALLSSFAILLAFWQVARGTIFNSLVSDSIDLAEEVPAMLERLLTRGDLPYYYNASLTAIDKNFNEGFSIPWGLVRRQVFFFFPVDWSFGLKPEDMSATFSDVVDGGDDVRRGNMPPGLIGLLVLSFEWWGGWIVALGLPGVLRIADNFIRSHGGAVQVGLASNFLSATLLLLRGDDSSASYFIIFTIIFLFGLQITYRIFSDIFGRPTDAS